jgi:RNA recognition motif-containing protein
MPKFKTTNQFKGFAFIEFSSKDEAKKAIQVKKIIIIKININ